MNCPAELRQQILSYCLPSDVHNAGAAPSTAALLPLLLTCNTIRLDVLQLLKTWSPLHHIEDPSAIISPRRLRLDYEPPMRRISLRLFATLNVKRMHLSYGRLFDVDPWLRCVTSLPPRAAGVESVEIDLTPAPAWMTSHRPDWVRATVLDARNRTFLSECADDVRRLVGALCEFYDGAGVRVRLGGLVRWKDRRAVEDMMVGDAAAGLGGAGLQGFVGEWLSGPAEVPTRLSLGVVCRCWGIEVVGPAARDWWNEQKMKLVRHEVSTAFGKGIDHSPLPGCFFRKSKSHGLTAEISHRRARMV